MIKLTEVRAKFFPLELDHHKFGIAIQPLLYLNEPPQDNEGFVDYSRVAWPSSQCVKDNMVILLQSSAMPNIHLNSVKWKEAVEKGDFPRRESAFCWPNPRREDVDTEPEDAFEDTSGK